MIILQIYHCWITYGEFSNYKRNHDTL